MIPNWKENIVAIREPESWATESLRTLRAKLSRGMSQGKRRLMMTSTWAGDGKSTLCCNLAVIMAQLQLKVALLDGDLRRPTLTRVFSADEKPGIMNFLDGTAKIEEIVIKTGYEQLDLLPRGKSDQNPANLLGLDSMNDLFNYLKKYACVIIDTPPLSACSDALLMGTYADAAILVVNPTSWDGEIEKRYVKQLEEVGIEVLGFVLNGAEEKHAGYDYGYGYGYGGYGRKGYGSGYGQSPKTKS